MIRITTEDNTDTFSIKVRGHAGYASRGTDIVCSSVSILVYTLIDNLTEEERVQIDVNKGNVYICAKGNKAREKANMIMKGFDIVRTLYPENVCLRGALFFDI